MLCFVLGVTGGLAAPLVAAGAGAVLGAGGAAVLGSATGIAIMASLFGAAGAGLTGELKLFFISLLCRHFNQNSLRLKDAGGCWQL